MSDNLSKNDSQPLQAWKCTKCGATLPAEAGMGELVTCGYCGTAFKLPMTKARSGGVVISGVSVTVGGNVVNGDMVVVEAGSSRTAESDSARLDVTPCDGSADSVDKGVTIDSEEIQVAGHVISGSVMKIVPPARKLSWQEKIKRMFSN